MSSSSLAVEFLHGYEGGLNVASISASSGMTALAVMTRLCAAARLKPNWGWPTLDPEGSLGIQWEFVYWRG